MNSKISSIILLGTLLFFSTPLFSQNPVCEGVINIDLDTPYLFAPDLGEGNEFYPNTLGGFCSSILGVGGKEQMYRFVAPSTGTYNLQTLSNTPANSIIYFYKLGDSGICDASGWDCLGSATTPKSMASIDLYAGQVLLLLAKSTSSTIEHNQSIRLVGPTPFALQTIQQVNLNQETSFSADTLLGSTLYSNELSFVCENTEGTGGQEKMYVFTAPYSGIYRIRTDSVLNSNSVVYRMSFDLENLTSNAFGICLMSANEEGETDTFHMNANQSRCFLLNAVNSTTPTYQSFTIEYSSEISLPFEVETIFVEQEVHATGSIPSDLFNGNSDNFSCNFSANSTSFYRFTPEESGYYFTEIDGTYPGSFDFGYNIFPENLNNFYLDCWPEVNSVFGYELQGGPVYFAAGVEIIIGLRSTELEHDLIFKIKKYRQECQFVEDISLNETNELFIPNGEFTNFNVTPCGTGSNKREKHFQFIAQEDGYYSFRQISASSNYKILYNISTGELPVCEILNWECSTVSGASDNSYLLNLHLNQGEVLNICIVNSASSINRIYFVLEQVNYTPCENIIETTTNVQNALYRSSSSYPLLPFMTNGSCTNFTPFVGRAGNPQIFHFHALNSGSHNLKVHEESGPVNTYFAYYYLDGTSDPCNLTEWSCLGRTNVIGQVATLQLSAGESFYIMVVPLNLFTNGRQNFSITEASLTGPVVNVSFDPYICPDTEDGEITISVNNNSLPYTVVWDDLGPSETNFLQRTNLSTGNYGVSVLINETTEYYTTYHIEERDSFYLFPRVSLPNNANLNNGFIELNVFNEGTGYNLIPYSSNTSGIYGLSFGEHCFSIIINDGCIQDYCINLEATNELSFSYQSENNTCIDGNNGSISLEIEGGVAPYTIVWNDSESALNQFDRFNLSTGNYEFTIFDSDNNSIDGLITISSIAPIITFETIIPNVFESITGSVNIMPQGGNGNYLILWDHLETENQPFQLVDLPTGEYCYQIIDEEGCSLSECIYIPHIGASPLQIGGDILIDPCLEFGNQYVDPEPIGGIGPYTYDWAHIFSEFNEPYVTIPDLEGEYSLTITDYLGTQVTQVYSFSTRSNLYIGGDVTPTVNYNSSVGQIELEVFTNNPPLTIEWIDFPDNFNSNLLTNLPEGAYSVLATDNIGCEATRQFYVNTTYTGVGLEVEIISPSCANSQNGSIDLQLVEGTPPISYDWSHIDMFVEPQDITNLNAGTYVLYVTDANGLTGNYVIEVEAISTLDVQLNPTAAASEGSMDGSIEAVVTGGVPPYQIIWSHLDYLGPTEMFQVGQLNPGLYYALVSDGEGCVVTASTTIDNISSVDQINDSESGISIYPNPSNGTFIIDKKIDFKLEHLEIYNNLGQLVKSLSPNFSRQEVTLPSGNYYLKITSATSSTTKTIQIY